MAEEVQYKISLHDNFSSVMKHAEEATERMEKGLERVNEMGKEMLTTIGLSIAAFKGFEFIKEGMEEYRNIRIETALFNNELKNSGVYTKELVDNLKEMREQLSNIGFYKETEQLAFQRQMLGNFPHADLGYLEKFQQTAADVAANKGISLSDAGNQIDAFRPSRKGWRTKYQGLKDIMGDDYFRAHESQLRGLGDMDINKAYPLLLDMIEKSKVHNAAKTKMEADPEYEFRKKTEEFSVTLGEVGENLKVAFLPEMIKVEQWLDDMVKNHLQGLQTTLKIIVDGLVGIAALFAVKKTIEAFTFLASLPGTLMQAGKALLFGVAKQEESTDASVIGLNSLAGAAERAAIALNLIGGEGATGAGIGGIAGGVGGGLGKGRLFVNSEGVLVEGAEGATTGGLIGAMTSNPAGWVVMAATAAGIGINYWATHQANFAGMSQLGEANKQGEQSDQTTNSFLKKLAEKDNQSWGNTNDQDTTVSITDQVRIYGEKTVKAMKDEQSKSPHMKGGNSPNLPKNKSSDLNVHGPKNTNIYVTINGGLVGKIDIENTSTAEHIFTDKTKKHIQSVIVDTLTGAVRDSVTQVESEDK